MGKREITVLIVVIVITAVTAGYFVWKNISPTLISKPYVNVGGGKLLDLTLKVDAPFSTATLAIQENGDMFYAAKPSSGEETHDSGHISEFQKMVELTKLVEDINFLNMEDRPKRADDPEDGSMYTITVRILPEGPPELADPGVYSVSCYQFNCEPNFLKLKDKIIELWSKEVLEIGV